MRLSPWFALVCGLWLVSCGSKSSAPAPGGGGSGGSGGSTSPVPIYVLVGGATAPTATDVYRDTFSLMNPGEVFIMAKDALQTNSLYRVDYTLIAGGTTFTNTSLWSFTTGATAGLPVATGTVNTEINHRRTQANVANAFADSAAPLALTVAAQRHAGYQCENNNTISHDEPNNARAFFVANVFADRIAKANGDITPPFQNWPYGANRVYETISTSSGIGAINTLWNSVYHRLPMLRNTTTYVGFGDRSQARTDSIWTGAVTKPFDDPTIDTDANHQFMTMEWAGTTSIAVTASRWPAHSQVGVNTTFNTNTEAPDPIGDVSGTPVDDLVGAPIHLVLPTAADFTSVTVTLTKL